MKRVIKVLGVLTIASLLSLTNIEITSAREPNVVYTEADMVSTCPDDVGYSVWVVGASREEVEKTIPEWNIAAQTRANIELTNCTHTLFHRHGTSPTGEKKETADGTLVVLPGVDSLSDAQAIHAALREAGKRAYILYFNNWGE